MKQRIRLSESKLRGMIREAVKSVLREGMEQTMPNQIAYGLMVMLGEIQNEMMRGGDSASLDEIDEMYGMAVELNDYFDKV